MTQLLATLDLLRELTSFASVAGNLSQQQALAQRLEDWLAAEVDAQVVCPVSAQLAETSPPLVHVRVDIGAPQTVVLYNMYDVMPAAREEGWEVEPFVGGFSHRADKGDIFIARGAENNKGPLAGMLMALRDLHHAGQLHANVEILLEGEGETGSGHLRRYLAGNPCPLEPAQAVLFPSLCEYDNGAPRIYLGFNGLSTSRLCVRDANQDESAARVHAGIVAWIADPASGVLSRQPLDEEAALLLADLARSVNHHDELRFRRGEKSIVTGDTFNCLSGLLTGAVLSIADFTSGPQTLPGQACAELALRTPPGMDAEALLRRIRQRLQHPDFAGVTLEPDDTYPGYRFSEEDAGVLELMASYHQQQARPRIWPWAPDCVPASAFAPVAPAFVIGGLGEGGNARGVNEFVTLRGLERYQRSVRDWLLAF